MHKKSLYTLLGLLALLLLPSCLKDSKEIFDRSAAARIDELVAKDRELLESAPGGWRLQYYAGRDYSGPGFTLLMKFAGGHVTIMGDNGDPELASTTEYAIVKDQGPVLTFPTFNAVLHPLASASLGHPEGIQGDYEFAILSTSTDSIRLVGKKWGNEMLLTRLPEKSSFEELLLGMLSVREEMTANTYDFILDGKPLAQGEINTTSRHLTATLEGKSHDIAYTFHEKGITLQRPLVLGGKSYQSFTWDSEKKRFTSGGLTIQLFIPKSHKPIDFWYGTWTMRHNPIRGWRKPTTLTLEAGDKANTLKGTLNFRGVDYKLILPYDPATGTITFVGQPLHDPTNKYAGGVVLIPISLADGRKLLSTDHSITFTWDEDQQQAIAKGSEMADGKVDSFFGVAYGEDLKPVVDKNGNYVFPIAMENIQFLKKSN